VVESASAVARLPDDGRRRRRRRHRRRDELRTWNRRNFSAATDASTVLRALLVEHTANYRGEKPCPFSLIGQKLLERVSPRCFKHVKRRYGLGAALCKGHSHSYTRSEDALVYLLLGTCGHGVDNTLHTARSPRTSET
jgi:hypothetical protein